MLNKNNLNNFPLNIKMLFFSLKIFLIFLNTFLKIKTIKQHLTPNTIVPYNYKKINETEMLSLIFSHMKKQNLLQKLESKILSFEKLELIKKEIDIPIVFNMKNGGLMKDFEN